MSDKTIIFFLVLIIIMLFLIILYQRFVFTRGIQTKLKQTSEKLEEILETGSDEKVMVFTDNKVLMELGGQINRLLINRQKIKADYKREEISSKKMLANISHDIKTPLTVILGYLEILRLGNADREIGVSQVFYHLNLLAGSRTEQHLFGTIQFAGNLGYFLFH